MMDATRCAGLAMVWLLAMVMPPAAAAPPMTPIPAVARTEMTAMVDAGLELAAHATAGATCGISSGNTARTCSPNAINACRRAAGRGVAGFTAQRCNALQTACQGCLSAMNRCIGRIGHISGRLFNSTCETCKSRLYRCLDARVPVAG
jgi:hypothetical protein